MYMALADSLRMPYKLTVDLHESMVLLDPPIDRRYVDHLAKLVTNVDTWLESS